MAFICGNQILAYELYESLSVPIFFGTESFPFQIFFGMESDSYITKCLISVQHSSSLISSIKKRIRQIFDIVTLIADAGNRSRIAQVKGEGAIHYANAAC